MELFLGIVFVCWVMIKIYEFYYPPEPLAEWEARRDLRQAKEDEELTRKIKKWMEENRCENQ